ncbi:methyltransferase domain-containing protein [Candidatus Gracilibacteria bacterium]|nr:methyltransferase domain-containing protein [Candidatus Gracilibacteria bacterium]
MRFFLITTRGLEDVAAAELSVLLPTVRDVALSYRRVTCAVPATDTAALLALHCAEDVFIEVASWQEIGKPRRVLDRITQLSSALDLMPALEHIRQLRPLDTPTAFAVSASFVGARNYASPEIKLAIATGLQSRYGWRYLEEEAPAALSLRLFIEHEEAFVGVRLAAQPLHRRSYKLATTPGSLKAPVAAGLLRLAGLQPGQTTLDPLCGAGTIVIEAAAQGARVLGGDSDETALATARTNLSSAGLPAELYHWDARRLPIESASIDLIATNLPFGRQVLPNDDLTQLYAAILAELARVARPGASIALLTTQPDALRLPSALRSRAHHEISLHGQRPVIVVLEVRG